jgi:hypothetical protein
MAGRRAPDGGEKDQRPDSGPFWGAKPFRIHKACMHACIDVETTIMLTYIAVHKVGMEAAMTDITYEGAAAAPDTALDRKKVSGDRNVWRVMYEAMVEARMREAAKLVKPYEDLIKRS